MVFLHGWLLMYLRYHFFKHVDGRTSGYVRFLVILRLPDPAVNIERRTEE